MRMTEQQIAEEYLKAQNKKEKIKNLAEINDCMPSDIKEILENQDVMSLAPVDKPKRGRPVLTEEEKEHKRQEKEAAAQRAKEIPSSVKQVVVERIETLCNSIRMHQQMVDKQTEELKELERFLNGC